MIILDWLRIPARVWEVPGDERMAAGGETVASVEAGGVLGEGRKPVLGGDAGLATVRFPLVRGTFILARVGSSPQPEPFWLIPRGQA